MMPCYREDEVVVAGAQKLLDLDYPRDCYDVVVIADSLQPETLKKLASLPIILLTVEFEKSTKTRSLNAAFGMLKKPYDIAIINDADNITEHDFLKNINSAFNAGFKVIQAQRVAKNLNTPFAILDAASEIINNHLFRKGPSALGLSSSIIGSGMAYEYSLLKEQLEKIDAVGGFDKVLQLNVLEKGIKILYLEGTLVFDEKIQSSEAFKNQRRRWISSQLIYARKYFLKGWVSLFKGNLDYFHQAVVYNLFPPRVLMLFFLTFFSLLFSIIFFQNITIFIRWWILLAVYSFSLAICLPPRFYNKQFFSAILRLPMAIIRMIQATLNIRTANQKFIHTKHSSIEVDHNVFTRK